MEFITPASLPTSIAATVILLAMVVVRIRHDRTNISQSNNIYRALINLGKKHALKSFSIMIELDRKADFILPLLDQLRDQNYKKLELIVIIKHTAGKNARSTIMSYGRKNPSIKIRTVKHIAKQKISDAILHSAINPYVMVMSPAFQLSKDFFINASLDIMAQKPDVLTIKSYQQLDNSLLAAYVAHIGIPTKISNDDIQVGVVYLRSNLLNKPNRNLKTINSTLAHATVIQTPHIVPSTIIFKQKIYNLPVVMTGIGAVTYVIIAMSRQDQLLLITLLALSYTVNYAINLLSVKAYSTLDKISLILLAPIFMVYRVLEFAINTLKQLRRR